MKFVIARPWNKASPDHQDLCIYTYHSEIQSGTIKQAKELLDYVHRASPGEKYDIYKITFEKI